MTAAVGTLPDRRVLSALPAVMAGAAACGSSFLPAVAGGRLPVLIAVAAVLPVLLAVLLGRVLHRPPWMNVVLSGAAWWLGTMALLPAPGGFFSSFGEPGAALGKGVRPLLEWVPPAPERPELLIVPFLLAWLAAGTGAELVTRGATGPVAMLPAWCVWVFAVTFAVPATGTHVATAVVLLAATIWLARPSRRTSPSLAVVGLLVAGAGVAAAAAYGGDSARDVRSMFPADRVPDDVLAEYDQWRARPNEPLFEVTGSALAPADGRWRLAELVAPDRDRWVTSTSFRRSGGAAGPAADDRTVVVIGLRSAFLPTLGSLASTSDGTEVWTAPGTSMMVRADRGATVSYAVRPVPVAGRPSKAEATVPVGCGAAAADLVRRAGLPPGLDADNAGAPAARIAAVLGPTAASPAGGADERAAPYSCRALARAVRDRHATEVQRALAYVLATRHTGVPSRIAVGFADGGVAERRTISGADARVWPEVWVGGRWVAMPVPSAGPVAPPVSPPPAAAADPAPPPAASGGSGQDRRRLTVVLIVVLLTASAVLGGRLLRAVQNRSIARASRRQGTTADRVVAAWRDTVGELSRPGPALPAGATPREVVAAATGRLTPEAASALRSLAGDVVEVLYGGAAADDKTAAAAWRRRDDVARAVRRGASGRGGRRSPTTRLGAR